MGAANLLPLNEAIPEKNLLLSQAHDQRARLGFFFLLLFTVVVRFLDRVEEILGRVAAFTGGIITTAGSAHIEAN